MQGWQQQWQSINTKKGYIFHQQKTVRKGRCPTASASNHVESESELENALALNPKKVEIQYDSDGDPIGSQENFYKNSSAFQSDDDSVDLNVYYVPS
jgi:hypothetical protein